MKYNKRKGFSLAELLIALLVISIVLSAAIPTITKKNTASGEKIWRWSDRNMNNIYFGLGENQSVIIGADAKPLKDSDLKSYFPLENLDLNSVRFSTDGDRLMILKESLGSNTDTNNKNNFVNSHISFYNLARVDAATDNQVTYAGRIASDQHNLAFGVGTLQNLHDATKTFLGYNTAIGHYALFHNTTGEYNTAIGEKTLTYITQGKNNTALGYSALERAGKTSQQNTALGSFSMKGNVGNNNTAVGYYAMSTSTESSGGDDEVQGNNNTAIGANACSNIKGNNNLCIGAAAGAQSAEKEINNAFFIGKGDKDVPFMFGSMYDSETSSKSSLNINTDAFVINKIMRTGDTPKVKPIFYINGEQNGTTEKFQNSFYFIVTQNSDSGNNIGALTLSGNSSDEITIDTQNAGDSARNILFSDRLFMGLSEMNGGKDSEKVSLNAINDKKIVGINNAAEFYRGYEPKTVLKNKLVLQETAKTQENVLIQASGDNASMTTYGDFTLTPKGGNGRINLDGYVVLGGGEVVVHKGGGSTAAGLQLKNLDHGKGGYVKEAIDEIWEEIKDMKDKLSLFAPTPSDERLKDNISDNNAGLKEITALEVKNYTYKNDKDKTPHVGVIAQQLQKVFPNSVIKGKDGYLSITKDEIFYALVNSVKELCKSIQDLTAKITGLDKRITELEKQNQILKKQNAEFEKRLSKLEKASKK